MPKSNNHNEDIRSKATQDVEELAQLEKESQEQKLPEQKVVFKADSIKSRAGRRGVHNLPDQTNPPMGFDSEKAFDSVFPFLKLPYLQPNTPEDIISFGSPDAGGFLDQKQKKIPLNAIFFGDNLHILRALPSNCIDLIYIDPPFFSGRNYNQIWGDDNEVRTFHDIWEDGLPSYLVWLNARFWEMRRILKNTGSIYVHCDWHASHYIKCEMDKIFGYGYCEGDKPMAGFRRQIIWSLGNRGGNVGHYPKNHEVILFYTKSGEDFIFNVQKKGYSEKLKKSFKQDKDGRWYYTRGSRTGRRKLADWEIESQVGKKTYVDPDEPDAGTRINDLWDEEVIAGYPSGAEKIGYPTQKPESLLERIIKTSSKEGNIVADFFMGGGTTCAVAQKLNRRFIGCDISRVASSVTLNRLIKDAEEISGRTASVNIDKPKKDKQISLELTIKHIPDIRLYYMGVYPIEKFEFISQKEFEDFILTCYESRRFTGEGEITGVMNASTSILIGSVKPSESIPEQKLKNL